MLQRNLLYTGVTRAKKILVLIGEKRAVSYAIRNETTKSRNTKLAQRLAEGKNTGKMAEHMQDTSFKNNNANDCNDSIMQKPEKTSDLGNKRNSDKSQGISHGRNEKLSIKAKYGLLWCQNSWHFITEICFRDLHSLNSGAVFH